MSCFCKIKENLVEYRMKERGGIEGMEGKRQEEGINERRLAAHA